MANSEKQYIGLYKGNRNVVDAHGSVVMNAVRDKAMADFERLGFPSLKDEKYRYTDVDKVFSDDYGLNIARLAFPVNPYEAFKCDVPNLSTQLYFMENDMFYTGASGVRSSRLLKSIRNSLQSIMLKLQKLLLMQ